MDRRTKRHIWMTLIIALFINSGLLLLDYFNIPGKIGIDISKINFDIISLVISNTVVVALFLITYFVVDFKNIQKDKNQLMTAYITLIGIYERCIDMVEIFSQDNLRERAAKRCDGDKYVTEDKAFSHFLNYPFENEGIIYNFASAGVLSKEIFTEFVRVKQHYQKYINVSIVFYDKYAMFKPIETEISTELSTALSKLKQSVENNLEVQK